MSRRREKTVTEIDPPCKIQQGFENTRTSNQQTTLHYEGTKE